MAENYKILAQEFAEDVDSVSGLNQAKIVYTVPTGNQVSASAISIINNSADSESYKLGIVKAADVASSTEEKSSGSAGGVLVAVDGGSIVYSTDGVTWSTTSIQTQETFYSVAYGTDLFLAVGSNTAFAYSTDGQQWSTGYVDGQSQSALRGVTHNGAAFYAVGDNALVVYNSDPSDQQSQWSSVQQLGIQDSLYGIVTSVGEPIFATVESILSRQTIIPTRTIEANTADEIVGGITLSEGDQIRVYSESDSLTIHIYGVEIS